MRPVWSLGEHKARARRRVLEAALAWQADERAAAFGRISGLAVFVPDCDGPTADGPIGRSSIAADPAGPSAS